MNGKQAAIHTKFALYFFNNGPCRFTRIPVNHVRSVIQHTVHDSCIDLENASVLLFFNGIRKISQITFNLNHPFTDLAAFQTTG